MVAAVESGAKKVRGCGLARVQISNLYDSVIGAIVLTIRGAKQLESGSSGTSMPETPPQIRLQVGPLVQVKPQPTTPKSSSPAVHGI